MPTASTTKGIDQNTRAYCVVYWESPSVNKNLTLWRYFLGTCAGKKLNSIARQIGHFVKIFSPA